MSTDDVYTRARELSVALESFHHTVGTTLAEVEQAHGLVHPLWDDTMRRDYDRQWAPLSEEIVRYHRQVGPLHMGFLAERLRHLQNYLEGHDS